MRIHYNVFVYFGEKLIYVFLILLSFMALGVLGFMLLEDLTFTEAVYMTVITLSTVGYRELSEPNQTTMWFTVILILSGVGVLTYSASIFAQELIDGRFLQRYKIKQVERKILNLKNHTIICGFGRNGQQAAKKLLRHSQSFVVIEKNEDISIPIELKDIIVINGDSTNDDVLISAGIEKAKSLITTLPTDANNLFTVLTARQLNPNIKIVSRASESTSIKKLKTAGADKVVMPDKIGGEHMARLLVLPNLAEFMESVSIEGDNRIQMFEIKSGQFPTEYIGKQLKELKIRLKTNSTVIAMKTAEGKYIVNPDVDTMLEENQSLIFLGTIEQIKGLVDRYDV